MKQEEENIRFVAKFYQKGKMNTSRAWKELNIVRPKEYYRYLLFRRIASVAAMMCLIAGLSYWLISDERQDWIVVSASDGSKELVLPDSTYITLASGGTLRYDRLAYGKAGRNVMLDGKAFFSVKHLSDNPFKVKTALATVQVLGTRFQVRGYADSASVTVESGKVRFSNISNDEAVLTKGMHASVRKGGSILVSSTPNSNTFAWKTHLFVYHDTPLTAIVKELEDAYKVSISGVPSQEMLLTTSFDNMTVNDIIDVINQTLDINLITKP